VRAADSAFGEIAGTLALIGLAVLLAVAWALIRATRDVRRERAARFEHEHRNDLSRLDRWDGVDAAEHRAFVRGLRWEGEPVEARLPGGVSGVWDDINRLRDERSRIAGYERRRGGAS
jgi:hypothetical protein